MRKGVSIIHTEIGLKTRLTITIKETHICMRDFLNGGRRVEEVVNTLIN